MPRIQKLNNRKAFPGLLVCTICLSVCLSLEHQLTEERRLCQRFSPTILVYLTAQMFMPWVKGKNTVKLRLLAPQGQNFTGGLSFPDIQAFIFNTYLRVPRNINNRCIHSIYHSVSCPVVLSQLPLQFLHYLRSILYIQHDLERPTRHQYFTIVIKIFKPMLTIN